MCLRTELRTVRDSGAALRDERRGAVQDLSVPAELQGPWRVRIGENRHHTLPVGLPIGRRRALGVFHDYFRSRPIVRRTAIHRDGGCGGAVFGRGTVRL
ncbi:hypothetical protein FGB62_329g07 [Gracilaria domingensis]|nr:hypothetical protein FGB62_329g07 [Gracilaria domingensis]